MRFDGRFFTALVSTGIYCRPVCPAPTPLAANVRFYACAAAAEAAGFRACLRCHPESAPGSPDWNLRADLAARALRLQYRPPFDAEWMLSYLALHAIVGVEEVRDGHYRRSLALGRSRGILELEPVAGNAVVLRVLLDDLRALPTIVQRCRQLFDLDAEPLTINAVLCGDPILAPLVAARPGLRVPGTVDGFEMAVRAILGQMVSVAAARTFGRRLVETAGSPLLEPRGALTHLFPTAERIAEADLDQIGITRSRVLALRALANAVAAGTIVLDRGAEWQETVARLRALPGIGPWTASYIAMRALGDPDAYPIGDLGLRRALERQGLAADPASVAARAEAWRPWRAYAVHHLWSTLPAFRPGIAAISPVPDPQRSDVRKPPAPRAAAR